MSTAAAAPAVAHSRSYSHAPVPPATATAEDNNNDDNNNKEEEKALPTRVRSYPRRRQQIIGLLRYIIVILKGELEEDKK